MRVNNKFLTICGYGVGAVPAIFMFVDISRRMVLYGVVLFLNREIL